MVKMIIEVNEDLHTKLNIFKASRKLKNLNEATVKILENYFSELQL